MTKESSVVFSIEELMRIEKERIAEEQAAAVALEQAEIERQEARERQAEEAEIERDKARRLEKFRQLGEEARLEGIKNAQIEKVRREFQHRTHMEKLAAELAHEERIAEVTNDGTKRKLKRIAAFAVGCLFVFAVGGGLLWSRASSRMTAEAANLTSQTQAVQAERDRLKRELNEKNRKVRDLEYQLETTPNAADRADISNRLNQAKKDSDDTRRQIGPRNWGVKPCTCPPGDPMCPCL